MSGWRSWSTSARALIVGVIVAGLAATMARVPQIQAWTGKELGLFAGLALAIAVGEFFQFELPYRTEKTAYVVTEALWTAALFLVSPSVLVAALLVGVAVGQVAQKDSPIKIAFNAGQVILAISVALLVYQTFGAPAVTEPQGWLAAAAAMAAYQAVNNVLVDAVISAIEHQPFWQVVFVTTGILHWVGNLAIGILVALLWVTLPQALPLLAVPLVLTFLAYRGWLRSIEERDAMHEMARTAEDISRSGDVTTRLNLPPAQDDARALATRLNVMLGRLDAAFQRERLFIRETSHELRTPITICRGHLELLDPVPTAAELQDTVELVIDELDRMARIVEDMNTLARMEDPASLRREDVDVDVLIADVAAKAATLTDGRLQVTSAPAAGRLRADPQRLTQALINLLKNAAQHTPSDAKIELLVSAVDDRWRFEVTDHGDGVPKAEEESVFLPFCTGGSRAAGNGLGLAIVSGIARAHGGTTGLDNRPSSGATFWLEVPR